MEKQAHPLVSIIMNCLNGERFLKSALDSVYKQTINDWEIIFWDNYSSDNSAEITKSYDNRLKYHRGTETTSLGKARNLALREAKGKYVAFLDCDDLFSPDKLEKQLIVMEDGDYNISYGGVILINENDKIISKKLPNHKSGNLLEAMLWKYEIHFPTVMLRRSTLLTTGLTFETQLRYSPDYNLFMQFVAIGKVGVVQEIIAKYRVHSDQLSNMLLDRVSTEMKYTLDLLSKYDVFQNEKMAAAISFAYAKLNYYDAIDYINKKQYGKAKTCLSKISWKSPKIIALYLLVLFQIPREAIMWLLRRKLPS